jgi:hypothetical protein
VRHEQHSRTVLTSFVNDFCQNTKCTTSASSQAPEEVGISVSFGDYLLAEGINQGELQYIYKSHQRTQAKENTGKRE